MTRGEMRTMALVRRGVWCVVLGLASASMAGAAVTIECPADGTMAALTLRYDADFLTVADAIAAADLRASLEVISPEMFAIRAAGPMEAAMPEPAALDACLAAKLQEQGATPEDTDAVAYTANLCRLKLAPSATAQRIEARFEITALDPAAAMVFIQRQYQAPSAVTGAPLTLDEFPPRNCVVVTGP